MNKTILVTGGSRGIGAATSALLARRGYCVAVNFARDADSAARVVADAKEQGVSALAIGADLADEDQVVEMFRQVDEQLPPLAGLVNNAGTQFTQSDLVDMDAARIRRVLDVNVTGAMICAREAVRRLSTERGGAGGAIVNVSSVAAVHGGPTEYLDYAASKGAVDTLTIGLAKEVATQGIRVNAVRPGIIETEIHALGGEPGRAARLAPQIPMQRPGRAQEVAEAIVWLLDDAASYVTGAILNVSGGR